MRSALVPLLVLAACSTTTPPGRAPDSAPPSPDPELPDCSDAAQAQPAVRERWTASTGHFTLGISRDVPEGQNFDATVALHGVQFRGPAGATRTIESEVGRVTTGWLPG